MTNPDPDGKSPRRRDIDGLRAVAVLAIVAFHAWPDAAPGGFVGVDVFFVISGFLISRIILDERRAATFSFGGFYLRRARRILPAYLAVTALVAALAVWVLMPHALTRFGAMLAASGLFLTNMLLWTGQGYFEQGPRQLALTHLWSLGVEEQFYLTWPLLLALLSSRWLRPLRALAFVGLLAGSLALAQMWMAGGAANSAFYLFPARAWEFLLGGLLALGIIPAPGPRMANLAAVAGLGLILGAVALLSEASSFPGVSALAPCLGAALVIWSGQNAPPRWGAVLRWPPMVGVGLISYSLYLWHWPLLVLARTALQRPLALTEALGIVAASVVLAILTWRLVERPWRGPAPAPRPRHLAFALVPLLLLVLLGAGLFLGKGLPGRLTPSVLEAVNAEEGGMNPLRARCHANPHAPLPSAALCRGGAPLARAAGRYDVLVWGDSHADAVTPGVFAWGRGRGLSARQATRSGCPPLTDVRVMIGRVGDDPTCRAANRQLLQEIAANPDLKLIVLSARWPLYEDARPAYDPDAGPVHLEDALAASHRPFAVGPALTRTLDAIRATGTGAQVVVIGPVPELPFSVPNCVAEARQLHRDEAGCATSRADLPLARARPLEAELRRVVATRPFARAVFPTASLCAQDRCVAIRGPTMLYFDDDHLSVAGAQQLVPDWLDQTFAR